MFNKDSSRTLFYIAGFVLTRVGQSGLCVWKRGEWGGGGQTIDIKKNHSDLMFETFQLNVLFLYNFLTDVDSSMYKLQRWR